MPPLLNAMAPVPMELLLPDAASVPILSVPPLTVVPPVYVLFVADNVITPEPVLVSDNAPPPVFWITPLKLLVPLPLPIVSEATDAELLFTKPPALLVSVPIVSVLPFKSKIPVLVKFTLPAKALVFAAPA